MTDEWHYGCSNVRFCPWIPAKWGISRPKICISGHFSNKEIFRRLKFRVAMTPLPAISRWCHWQRCHDIMNTASDRCTRVWAWTAIAAAGLKTTLRGRMSALPKKTTKKNFLSVLFTKSKQNVHFLHFWFNVTLYNFFYLH